MGRPRDDGYTVRGAVVNTGTAGTAGPVAAGPERRWRPSEPPYDTTQSHIKCTAGSRTPLPGTFAPTHRGRHNPTFRAVPRRRGQVVGGTSGPTDTVAATEGTIQLNIGRLFGLAAALGLALGLWCSAGADCCPDRRTGPTSARPQIAGGRVRATARVKVSSGGGRHPPGLSARRRERGDPIDAPQRGRPRRTGARRCRDAARVGLARTNGTGTPYNVGRRDAALRVATVDASPTGERGSRSRVAQQCTSHRRVRTRSRRGGEQRRYERRRTQTETLDPARTDGDRSRRGDGTCRLHHSAGRTGLVGWPGADLVERRCRRGGQGAAAMVVWRARSDLMSHPEPDGAGERAARSRRCCVRDRARRVRPLVDSDVAADAEKIGFRRVSWYRAGQRPWRPPDWMKTHHHVSGSRSPAEVGRVLSSSVVAVVAQPR